MPKFRYKARTEEGQLRQGMYEATSADGVAEFLDRARLTPLEVKELTEQVDVGEQISRALRLHRVRLPDLVLFTRQMYALTKAGIPINRALAGLRESMDNPALAESMERLEDDLDAGRSLSESMHSQPHIYPPLMVSIMRVGEEAGQLSLAFDKVHGYLAFEYETTRKVKSAMRYPIIVMSAAAGAVGVLVGFVVPQFANVFARFKVELPWATRVMLGAAEAVTTYWFPTLIISAILVALTRSALRTPAGRYLWDGIKFRLPIFGPILLLSSLARFARALAISYGSGVSVVTSMNAMSEAVGNVHLAEAITAMRELVEEGASMSEAAESQSLFTPLVVQMLSVGEETGRIDDMMSEVADFYEHEVEYKIENLGAAIEPLLLLVMGGIVLLIALAVFLPMWDMSNVAR